MNALTIDAADKFLTAHTGIHNQLLNLIKISIAEKKAIFAKEEVADAEKLIENELFNESSKGRVEFNFVSLIVCRVYHQVAEEMMESKMPTEIVPALEYTQIFLEMIRQPKPRTYWYLNLAMELERYVLIWLNQDNQKDVSEFYRAIDEQAKEDHMPLRHFDSMYYSAFPYLTDEVPKAFEMLKFLHGNAENNYLANSAIKEVVLYNPNHAMELYKYARQHDGIALEDCLSCFLISIYDYDPEYAFGETIEIFSDKAEEGAKGLSRFNYNKESHIRAAYAMIHGPNIDIETIRKSLPVFYTRLVENKNCPEDISAKCFEHIDALLDVDDDNLKHNLIFHLGMIEGCDEQKVSLLNKVMLISPRYLYDIFKKIKNPAYLFGITKQAYSMHGPAVNFDLFSEAFSTLQHLNPEGFELELLATLIDNFAVIRLAGIRIMSSRYMGMYEVDFLKLNEKGQIRIIKTLLPHPHSIENLLPMILYLRKSKYESVRKILFDVLTELIQAYDENLLVLVKKELNDQDEDDLKLLNSLNSEFDEYSLIKKQKEALKEFDPRLNELQAFENYYQIEHESRAESMEKAQKMSFFAQTASHTAVIRGNAYKSTSSDQISKLSTVSTSMLMDMRYFMNPDEYQWAYQQQLSGMDYIDEDTP